MSSTRNIAWWSLFGVGLLCAIIGWLWVLQRLVKNETEVARARIRSAEERYLNQAAEDFSAKLKLEMSGPLGLPEIAKQAVFSGVWHESDVETSDFDAELVSAWRKRVREGDVTAGEFAEAIDSGKLEFGWIDSGRDVVAGMLLGLLNRGEPADALVGPLRQRVWNFQGTPLSPAFRLTLIRALMAVEPDDALSRLQQLESIRAVEGKVGELEAGEGYEVLTRKVDGSDVMFFWTREQLEKLLNDGSKEPLVLLAEIEDGRSGVAVDGLRLWSMLSIMDGELQGEAAALSGRGFVWIGGLTGLAVLGLAVGAVIFARRELRTAKMRTDLAASVAHELRTPLAGQRLLLETLLERSDQSKEEREEYIAMAFRENKRLGRLAEEFLTFSRLERGVLQLDIEAVDVAEAIDGAVECLREKWEDPDCQLTISLDEDLPHAAGDSQALVTVLRNLLENAWKYSVNPRQIDVKAAAEGDELRISVSDNGIGLSARERQRIFRQFYRVDRRLARTQDGLGLGLSIVKRLLESMHGRIVLTSEVGRGSKFTLRIPIMK